MNSQLRKSHITTTKRVTAVRHCPGMALAMSMADAVLASTHLEAAMGRMTLVGMLATTMTAAVATTGCTELVLQGFGSIVGPDCTVVEGSPGLTRGTLDLGAADRYQVIAKARTSKDANLAVTTAEVDLVMNVTAAQADVLAAAAADVGSTGFTCEGGTCTLLGPHVVPAVTTEAGIVDDERVLLVSLDAVSTQVGQGLQELVGQAQALQGTEPLGTIELVATVRLVAEGGPLSTPATVVVDLCDGCLAPSADRCASLGASVESLTTDICIAGQDVASARCACSDGLEATADGCP
jgi:hypothetical protein